MNEKIYGIIANEILKITSSNWKEIIFYGEFGEGSYEFEYYVNLGDNKFVKCFNLKDVSMMDILNLFKNINNIISEERKKISKDKLWTNCTLKFNKEGRFKMDFDYTDLSQNSYVYHEVWKYKYLDEMPLKENKIAFEAVNKYIREN